MLGIAGLDVHYVAVGMDGPGTIELVRSYITAKRVVIESGYAEEIAMQSAARKTAATPRLFVREAAWVVLSAGMRESVVRSVFGRLSQALHDFEPARLVADRQAARAAALTIFAHERKVDAILDIAVIACRLSEEELRAAVKRDPQSFIQSLPYMGPVTWRHLAKNLGVEVAKPDRHLARVARATARSSVDALCSEIADWLGEPVPVVDLVLWRWSILHPPHCGPACDTVLHSR